MPTKLEEWARLSRGKGLTRVMLGIGCAGLFVIALLTVFALASLK